MKILVANFFCLALLTSLAGCDEKSIARAPDHWNYEEPVDKVTGDTHYHAVRTVALDGGGTADMTADCRTLSIPFIGDLTMLAVAIVFFDKDGKGITIDTAGFDNDDKGYFRYSEAKGEEGKIGALLLHGNEVQLRGINTNNSNNELANMMLDKDAARNFARAPFAKVEIPLLNGEKPVFDLRPQDPALRKVLGMCIPSAVAPDAPEQREQNSAPAQSGQPAAEVQHADAPAPTQPEQNTAPAHAYQALQPPSAEKAAISPGFNCAKAANDAERMVCADPELSQLDLDLGESYARAMGNAPDKNQLQVDELKWLKTVRDACADKTCLVRVYNERIAALSK